MYRVILNAPFFEHVADLTRTFHPPLCRAEELITCVLLALYMEVGSLCIISHLISSYRKILTCIPHS